MVLHRHVLALYVAGFGEAFTERACMARGAIERPTADKADHRHGLLLRVRRERPRHCRAAECGQQFPPSEGDSHTPLPCEVRKGKDTTPRACCPNGAAPGAGGAHVGSTSIGRFALALRVGRGAAASESLPAPVYLSAGIVLARLIAPCEG